jgi:molybdopterin-containing oxidoreductase family membrane subunit
MILTGPFWWVFWGVQILLGSLVPLFLILGPGRNRVGWLGTAALLIVIGIVGVRLNIVIPPLQTSWAGGLPAEYHASVSSFGGYVPSVNEWLTSLAMIGIGVWGFLLVGRIIPLQPLEAEEES